ncbi:arm repeat protein [Chrysochromulina tobinii]|jgi:hypothetical protein|uniref:Arm repeat protein n=1 Tax=Chrysochromulina tobinii TaxID=1460289 RepID=A0A0M0JH04_9EUKA|nr:arm repeat protein [Chrysochromulina tobinii]|eukprot:KOO25498.1 arm repeat protein [Chrysochromulina sp. CCMP291]
MGESAAYVLKGIEDMLQTEVKYFSMVCKDGEKMYICLGKRALFLIDFEPPFQEQFYYAWVRRVIIDSDNLLLFQIDFHEGRQSLLLESFERSRLCDELAICWKADAMFRQWRWQPFPLKRGQCDVGRRDRARTAVEFTAAPQKMQRIEFKGYQLFLDDAYREDSLGADGMPSGRYRATGRDREIAVVVDPAASVSGLGRREKHSLRLAAERMARGNATDTEMMVLRSEQYHKKMNLVGDLASYGCWAVHLRTPQRDVGVIAIRRKFIPPVGDTYQDIFIVLHDDVGIEDAIMFMNGLERQADTLSPLVKFPFYDDTITKVKADALLYDEDSFSWFHAEGIISSQVDAARAFYKSIANLLNKEQCVEFRMEEVESETVIIEDPFRVIITLWDDAPGLNEHSDPLAWRNWRRRVARYLYWSIDGGLHPGEMDMGMLIKCHRMQSCTMRSRDILERLFDFFVHMSSDTRHFELDSSTLADKVGDPEFMQSFTMNKRPLLVLLEQGFLQRCLQEESPPKYIKFLADMINRPFEETGTELLVTLCNQIAMMSQIEFDKVQLIKEHVMLPLIELLRSDDDHLLLAVVKALVNLSSGNAEAKDMVVNEGGVRSIVPHLLNKPQELARAFCVLLKNCLTAPELRERILNDGAVAPLVTLLKKSKIQGAVRSDGVVAAAAAAVWNLTAHQNAKALAVREGAVEALVVQLGEDRSDEVWQKCAGCLMVLAANSDKNKEKAGAEGAIPKLVAVIKKTDAAGPRGFAAKKAALGALAVLTSEPKNIARLRQESFDLEKYEAQAAKDKDERVKMFIQQLHERLFGS